METDSVYDSTKLLDAASEFSSYPGTQTDASTKQFLDRFPLPIIINALENEGDVPGLENAVVACLERVFRTKYGSSLIPQYMPFVAVGLGADSQKVKYLACKTVAYLLENSDGRAVSSAARLVAEYDVYPLLLKGLVDGDEQVAAASMDAIKSLASLAEGIDIIFSANVHEDTHLRNLAARCSSLGRVRILALVVKLFSISRGVASVVYSSNLLSLLMDEVSNGSDALVTLSVLELLYELAEIEHSTEFLSKTTVLQLLSSLISDMSTGSILRSRAMMITGRLMSKENTYMFVDEFGVQTIISVISRRLGSLEKLDEDECECAIESLGQIGASVQGATLLLSSLHPAARYLVNAAFDRSERGKQLAALHALGNIVGEARSGSKRLLRVDAEESLKLLIYEAASQSTKFTPSGIFLSILQQESAIRLASYRLMTGLASRPWCLMEICARQEIINILSDAFTETTKIGMEARHNCCQAVYTSLLSSSPPKLKSDPALAGIVAKLDAALKRGPYLARGHLEAQPAVVTADRF